MTDLLTAVALIFVIEGLLYAAFPEGMKRMLAQALAIPGDTLRIAGLVAAAFGLLMAWLLRG